MSKVDPPPWGTYCPQKWESHCTTKVTSGQSCPLDMDYPPGTGPGCRLFESWSSDVPVYHVCHGVRVGNEFESQYFNDCIYKTFYVLTGETYSPTDLFLERVCAYVYGFWPSDEVLYLKTQVDVNEWWLNFRKRSDATNILVKMKW